MAMHTEYRWIWALAKDDASSVAVAVDCYRQRFGHDPRMMFVHPSLLANGFQVPLGVSVEGDGYLNRAMVAFEVDEREVSHV